MSEIINLRTRRKQVARETARKEGTAKAARHGQSKGDLMLTRARIDKATRDLDAHRLSDPESPA